MNLESLTGKSNTKPQRIFKALFALTPSAKCKPVNRLDWSHRKRKWRQKYPKSELQTKNGKSISMLSNRLERYFYFFFCLQTLNQFNRRLPDVRLSIMSYTTTDLWWNLVLVNSIYICNDAATWELQETRKKTSFLFQLDIDVEYFHWIQYIIVFRWRFWSLFYFFIFIFVLPFPCIGNVNWNCSNQNSDPILTCKK